MCYNLLLVFLSSIILLLLCSTPTNCTNSSSSRGMMTTLSLSYVVPPASPDPGGLVGCSITADGLTIFCASDQNVPVSFSVSPFALMDVGTYFGSHLISCDYYDTNNPATALVFCAKYVDSRSVTNYSGVFMYQRVGLNALQYVASPWGPEFGPPSVAVDSDRGLVLFTGGGIAICRVDFTGCYFSNMTTTPGKSFDDQVWIHFSLLQFGETVFVHFSVGLVTSGGTINFGNGLFAGLLRYSNITDPFLAVNSSVIYALGNNGWGGRTLARDDHYVYDLCRNEYLVRVIHTSSTLQLAGELPLNTNDVTEEIALSPDRLFLLITAVADGIFVVNTSTFSTESETPPPSLVPTTDSGLVPCLSFGRPVFINDTFIFSFSGIFSMMVAYHVVRVPRPVLRPVLYPLPESPIPLAVDIVGASLCAQSSSESRYAACLVVVAPQNLQGQEFSAPARFVLEPFAMTALGALGSIKFDVANSGVLLYESGTFDTSVLICVFCCLAGGPVLQFYSALTMSPHPEIANLTLSQFQYTAAMVVDSPSSVLYATDSTSLGHTTIIKIAPLSDLAHMIISTIQISSTGLATGLTVASHGWLLGGHQNLQFTIDGNAVIQLYRVNITDGTFFFNSTNSTALTANLTSMSSSPFCVVASDEFAYYATGDGVISRFLYHPYVILVDQVNTGQKLQQENVLLLSFSPDHRYLFAANGNAGTVQMINVSSGNYLLHGDPARGVPSNAPPFVMSDKTVFVFPTLAYSVYALSYACSVFPETECLETEQCAWCPLASQCVDRFADTICSCALGTADNCSKSGACFWCGNNNISYYGQPPNSIDLCVPYDPFKSDSDQQCSCAFLDKDVCSQEDVPCSWCDSIGICIDKEKFSKQKCSSSSSSSSAQSACESDCFPCTFNDRILLGATDPQPYCAVNPVSNCSSPPACNTINSASSFDVRRQCEASGCRYDPLQQKCENQDCFSFFINSFSVLPIAMVFFGFVKDIFVLLILGWIGDWLKKLIQRKILRFTYWRKNWDKTKIKPNLDFVVYVNDPNFRDNNNNNSDNKKQESFEDYCKRIVLEIFDVKFDGIEENEKEQGLMMRRILDSVTFCMQNSGLFFELDKKIETDESADGEENEKHEKIVISVQDTKSRFQLQKIVTAAITRRATSVIFYASSRSTSVRMAAALTSFPSSVNLAFYIASVLVMFAFTLRAVLKNGDVIERMSGFTCDSSSQSSASSPNSSFVFQPSSSQAKSIYWLLGFRLMNASAVATVMLLLVKTIRALWSGTGNGDRFNELTLPQRLPIMNLFTSRATQVLLILYFGIVLVFAFGGVTFGLKLIPTLIVVGAALILILVDMGILRVVRSSVGGKSLKNGDAKKEHPEELTNPNHDDDTASVKPRPTPRSARKSTTAFEHAGAVQLLAEPMRNAHIVNETENDDASRILVQPSLGASDPTSFHLRRLFEPTTTTKKSTRNLNTENSYRNVADAENDDENDDDGFEEIDHEAIAEMKTEIATNVASVTNLFPSFVLFLFRDEFPTIILTIAFQACFNFVSFYEYRNAFGIDNQMDLFSLDYNAGDLDCVWRHFDKELSSIVAILTSFVPFA